MHRRIRPRVASCSSRAPLLSPWLSRSRCRSSPTLTVSRRHHCPPPPDWQVPAGNKAFLEGHAVGTQNYICVPCPNPTTPMSMCPNMSRLAWILFTPQATLFKDNHRQVITHFFSPNPFEDNTNRGVVADDMIRATWRDSRDTSTVWAKT